MATTELFTPRRAPTQPAPWSDVRRTARATTGAEPCVGGIVDETDPFIGVVPLYGPPVIVLAAPRLLVRHLRGSWTRHAPLRAAPPHLVVGASR
jgi:hypothetical protein